MRLAAVLDGTTGTAELQARALGGFLRAGLTGDLTGETLVFYDDERDRDRMVALSPTPDVRLVRTAPWQPAWMVDVLAASAAAGGTPGRDDAISLFLFAAGATGTELAARLAWRCRGAALTDALSAEAGPERLVCRKNVYSNHVIGRFELTARPWCVSLDPSWGDEPGPADLEHRVLSDVGTADAVDASPFEDAELETLPTSGDLADSRFLVVAGYGAGSRVGVERIAAAARLMGADFGISRPVAMNAWAPMDRLIGVSGARTAPVLCIVVGASGAPGLHWGIEKAGFIVAINPDAEAPIARNADAVLFDDGVATIEELAEIVAAHRAPV
jgi:electron transfer flavoprotein alpha subunit